MYRIENARAVPKAKAKVVQIAIREAALGRKILRMFENVSNAADRMDQRL